LKNIYIYISPTTASNVGQHRFSPEVRQGFWKHTHTLVRARSEEETYKWEDLTHRVQSTNPPKNIVYCSCRLPKKAQEQRELIRQKYSIERYKHKEYSLQELCLQAHSSKGQTTDTLVLEVTEGEIVHIPRASNIATETYRITLEDSRGIPIKARNLEPYNHSSTGLEQVGLRDIYKVDQAFG
jgi:hypothetical protein